ncbi:hypothetical protein EJ05DRAFT_183916 [Pseudovirgaria hyperparasitica]|uniref:Uncharacterized protein n=1 Tax=Pseudovirgaria hyperparasitica TaxID=470096 RepID=A0A6A6WG32_9PEZI|nr:uncharacterized protein EJ05DRAFT_183916 [Pseudovirgaria hyperparasitica]KAF2761748.1 hypothetical protein EJ05DRAFT_183916 [Pseudovirgaria hyperparasitica]
MRVGSALALPVHIGAVSTLPDQEVRMMTVEPQTEVRPTPHCAQQQQGKSGDTTTAMTAATIVHAGKAQCRSGCRCAFDRPLCAVAVTSQPLSLLYLPR